MPTDNAILSLPPVGPRWIVRTRRRVQLGPIGLEIRSNEADPSVLRYFPRGGSGNQPGSLHYRINLCNWSVDGPWDRDSIWRSRDTSYRAGRFAMGYYITDHFGAPACLITHGTEYWIFASDFERILWPYLVKYLLTAFCLERELLHLKAAGVSLAGRGTLLVARGGGGKTLLLAQLCQVGAEFVSNTHALIDGQNLVSVPTAVRIRNDHHFGPIIAARGLPPAIKAGEFTADPIDDLGWICTPSAPLRNICLIDYRPGNRIIREMDRERLFDYMDQFALALNVYGLKEDLLDYLSGNIDAFCGHLARMRSTLRRILGSCGAYYVSCDCTDPVNLRDLLALLRG